MTTEEMKKSSDSPPPLLPPSSPMSFSSLPYDIALNCLARISRTYYSTLFLVSKTFRSILTSPDLDATRSTIGKTEKCLYVCVNLNETNYNPSWLTLVTTPKQEKKLISMPSFPYHKHPKSSTVLSTGSKIYIMGGFVNGKRSRGVFLLDCQSHQWRRLPKMRVRRAEAAADVIDRKIYVIGGSRSKSIEDWGEVYDPNNQTWESLFPTTLDLTVQMSTIPHCLVMDGKVYDMDGLKPLFKSNICLVEIEKNKFGLCKLANYIGFVYLSDPKNGFRGRWRDVKGLEGLPKEARLTWVTNSPDGGRRVTVWWTKYVYRRIGRGSSRTRKYKKEIWCAEVSLERRGFLEELWGFVESSKKVLTLDKCDSPYFLFLHSTIVTH